MFNLFSKPDPKDQLKESEKALKKAGRDLERERRELEREEKKIELEIKKLAREGNKEGCKVLAKQLLELRKQKNRTYAATSKIQSVSAQSKSMGATVKVADAMGATTKVMANVNKTLKLEQVNKNMTDFRQAVAKMDMTEEMINDTMDDILAESGDEEESDNIISQVLDEIGIEVSGRVRSAPTPDKGALSSDSTTTMDKEILEKLEKLKS